MVSLPPEAELVTVCRRSVRDCPRVERGWKEENSPVPAARNQGQSEQPGRKRRQEAPERAKLNNEILMPLTAEHENSLN